MKIKERYISKVISSLLITIVLLNLFLKSNSLLSKIIVLLFCLFSISLTLLYIFSLFNKDRLINIFKRINTIIFFSYWFLFLTYYDYLCLIRKNYQLLVLSLIMWVVGIWILKKEINNIKLNKRQKKISNRR